MNFKSVVTALFSLSLLFALFAPARADDSRGHGSIYYSPSAYRYGWARSLESDKTARRVAYAMCQGGPAISSEALSRYGEKRAGAGVMSATPVAIDIAVSDCVEVDKFRSESNHQCEGFAWYSNGRYAKYVRESDIGSVNRGLADFPPLNKFAVCNDEASVQGGILGFFDKLAKALATPTPAPVPTAAPYVAPVTPYVAPIPPIYNGGGAVMQDSIRFRNTFNQRLSFTLKCPNENATHSISVAAGDIRTVSANEWNASCSQYNFAITIPHGDGSTSEVDHLLAGGTTYELFYDAARSTYDTRPAAMPMTVVNRTQQSVIYHVQCPNQQKTDVTLAPGAADASGLACGTGEILIGTGSETDAVVNHYPVVNGRAYAIQSDANGILIIVPA
jgi:hypothetical protein